MSMVKAMACGLPVVGYAETALSRWPVMRDFSSCGRRRGSRVLKVIEDEKLRAKLSDMSLKRRQFTKREWPKIP